MWHVHGIRTHFPQWEPMSPMGILGPITIGVHIGNHEQVRTPLGKVILVQQETKYQIIILNVKIFPTCWVKFLLTQMQFQMKNYCQFQMEFCFFVPSSLCVLFKFPSYIVVAPCLCISKFPSNNLTTCLHICLKLFPLQKISRIMNLDNFFISVIKSRRFHLFINHVLCFICVLGLNVHDQTSLANISYMLVDHKS